MENHISVSIVIPVYNCGSYIERCVRSVMQQTYEGSLECILVDDGSSDDSIEKVEHLIEAQTSKVRFVIIRHSINRGVSAARNTGIEASLSDYLFFLDSDDEITPDCIEQLVTPLKQELYDMVIGNLKIIGGNQPDDLLSLKLENGSILRQPNILNTYRQKWNMTPWNKLYRTGFIRENCLCFREGMWIEDELWSLQTACLLQSMRVVDKVTYIYYKHGSSVTANLGKDPKLYASYVTILQELRQFIIERHIYNNRLYFFIQWFFQNKYLSNFLNDKKSYIEKYREVRPLAWFEWTKRFMANGYSIKYHIRDLHYLLPVSIAPYWQYWLFRVKKGNPGK